MTDSGSLKSRARLVGIDNWLLPFESYPHYWVSGVTIQPRSSIDGSLRGGDDEMCAWR